jgi:hypothetical protein
MFVLVKGTVGADLENLAPTAFSLWTYTKSSDVALQYK